MFDVVEGLKILNQGRGRKFTIGVEEVYEGIKVEVSRNRTDNHYAFIIPREVIAGGGDEMLFMMHIHKALDDFGPDFVYSHMPLTYKSPVFKFDGV